ncbi:MAG: sigma-70 family RNA polymerase sigma factor [Planctomycetota bacterium]
MSPPTTQELLQHADFVRRIAAATVGENLADDIVQETYLAALRRPPRAGSRVRAWLATVTRNAARMALRSQARRRVHEHAAARPDRSRSTADAVSRVELHGRVVAEVLELDEPYRLTVIHRYFDNLPPREIARIMGVPVETVHVRLRRALGQLKGRMDKSHGCAWALLLLPALDTRALAATGATVMGKKTAVVLVVWALVATGLYVSETTGSAPPPRAPVHQMSRDTAAPPRAEKEPNRELTASEEMAEFQRRWRGSRTGLVRGQIVDRKGEPFQGVIRIRFEGTTPKEEKYTYQVTTDENGGFSVPDMRYPLSYQAHLTAQTMGVDAKRIAYVMDTDQPVRLRVIRRTILRGQVVDKRGRPVAGAFTHYMIEPRGGHWRGEPCDEQGRFQFPLQRDLEKGQTLRVIGAAPGHFAAWGEVTQENSHLFTAKVMLSEGPRVRVRVLDPEGKPYQGQVRLYAGRTYPMGKRPTEPSQKLMGGANGAGVMSDSSQNDGTEMQWISTRFKTNEKGEIDGWLAFEPETLHVVVDRGEEVPPWIKEVAGLARGTIDLGTVRLTEAAPARSVRLIYADGTPIAHVHATFRLTRPTTNPLYRFGKHLQTDADGWVKSGYLLPGETYRLTVYDRETNKRFTREWVMRDGEVLRFE